MARFRRSLGPIAAAATLLWGGAAGAADVAAGDPRFAAIVAQLFRGGAAPVVNDPSCPGAAEGKTRVLLGSALAGALAREADGGKPVGVSLSCTDTRSATTKECRLVFASTDPEAESSSGVAFELKMPGDRVVLPSVRCTMTP